MSKKKSMDLGKMIDAQAKGKGVKRVRTESAKSRGGELDSRQSKDTKHVT